MEERIGVTERGDAALDSKWTNWIAANKPAILITKDPQTLFNILDKYHLWDKRIIVHAVITGLTETILEPNVPELSNQFEGYRRIEKKLGPKATVLRVDPIIPTKIGLQRAKKVIKELINSSEQRIRISFMDNYNHVKERFTQAKIKQLPYTFHAPLEQRKQAYKELQAITEAQIDICGEPGFECIGCISIEDCMVLKVNPTKTKGIQRVTCACLSNKQELLSKRKPCKHKCLYCYWKD